MHVDVIFTDDIIRHLITGASQADVALLMVPADGDFTTAIAQDTHKSVEIQGRPRGTRTPSIFSVTLAIMISSSVISSGIYSAHLHAARDL